MKIVFRYVYMDEVVQFALETLRERSPVGSGKDPHPGLYRDSHTLFLNGRSVKDANDWKPGDVLHISNPVPYSRKIESGRMQMSVPPHVYEGALPIINGRFGNSAQVTFTHMPVNFGSAAAWSQSPSARRLAGNRRRGNPARHTEWLVRQPALLIRER